MTLDQYLTHFNISNTSFAELIGESAQLVSNYRLGKRIPRDRAVMRKIVAATNGLVTPNDFYNCADNSHIDAPLSSQATSASVSSPADG